MGRAWAWVGSRTSGYRENPNAGMLSAESEPGSRACGGGVLTGRHMSPAVLSSRFHRRRPRCPANPAGRIGNALAHRPTLSTQT